MKSKYCVDDLVEKHEMKESANKEKVEEKKAKRRPTKYLDKKPTTPPMQNGSYYDSMS